EGCGDDDEQRRHEPGDATQRVAQHGERLYRGPREIARLVERGALTRRGKRKFHGVAQGPHAQSVNGAARYVNNACGAPAILRLQMRRILVGIKRVVDYNVRIRLKLVEREQPLLVILGKQAIDDDNGQTGQVLAALWNRPQATYASKLELGPSSARVTREVDAGLETLEVDLPAVVTTDLRLNEPRYVKLPDIMKAKKKPLDTVALAALGIEQRQQLKLVRFEPP